MQRSAAYTIRFAAIVSVVGSILVATAAVTLRGRQEANRLLDKRGRVLDVAGLRAPGETLSREEVARRFEEHIRPVIIELATGEPAPDVDPETFDQRAATQDAERSRLAPDNRAGVARLPDHAVVYHVLKDGEIDAVILPVEGKGLWSTMFGFVAVSGELGAIRGITFYEHGETPGLGAEIDNPGWRAGWVGRRVFDESWEPRLEVIKGRAGAPEESPYEVDGLSGATLTGRGVTETLHFWLGRDGFGPYLAEYRTAKGIT